MKNIIRLAFIFSVVLLFLMGSGCLDNNTTSPDQDPVDPITTQHNSTGSLSTQQNASDLLAQKSATFTLVTDAVELIETEGEGVFDSFRVKGSRWYTNDTYIIVWDIEGIRRVFPPEVSGEGEDVTSLTDSRGNPVGKMFIETALSGEGWVEYYWIRPGQTTPVLKTTFVKRADTQNQSYVVASGFYVDDFVYTSDIADIEHFSRFGDVHLGNVLHPAVMETDPGVNYSIAHVIIKPGKSLAPHLMKNPEAYYVLGGEGLLYIDDIPFELEQGRLVLIPANAIQHTQNTGPDDLEFLAIDQPAWSAENEEILDAGPGNEQELIK